MTNLLARRLWDLSVGLGLRRGYGFGAGGGNARAGQTDWKPVLPCIPSQNGLFCDCPQRHNPMVVRPARSNGLPCVSWMVNSPSMRIEPLSRMVILAGIFLDRSRSRQILFAES